MTASITANFQRMSESAAPQPLATLSTPQADPSPPLTTAMLVDLVLEELSGPLLGYLGRMLHDADQARDVLQDGLIKLCQQPEGNIAPSALKSWIFTVCRRRALDLIRKEKRMTTLEPNHLELLDHHHDDTPVEAMERQDKQDELDRFLGRLSPNQREVIQLKFQNDMSYQEISDVTGLSRGNVGFLLHGGLKRLRELMTQAI